MRVLADTSVWSLALRRGDQSTSEPARELRSLIADHRIQMIGPIRQELLSGIREESQFDKLAKHLSAFPDIPLTTEDYVTAARFFNRCRARGAQGSNTDFLICAVSVLRDLAIYTTDHDFALFARHIPIVLHKPEGQERPAAGGSR
jgi:predicted nucleic acid-binding protein